jgi:hypothetical protein
MYPRKAPAMSTKSRLAPALIAATAAATVGIGLAAAPPASAIAAGGGCRSTGTPSSFATFGGGGYRDGGGGCCGLGLLNLFHWSPPKAKEPARK